MNKRTGNNKYGIKLEDYSDYRSYKLACRKAYRESPKYKLSSTLWYSNNRERMLKYQSDLQQTEKGKLQKNARNKKHAKTEKGKASMARYRHSVNGRKVRNATENKRRASKLQRTPAWADLEAIKQFYLNCPKGYEVDHIVPLQGVNVSGFHVLNNLQYLTKSENCSKGNKYAV
jgi:hypothetical protein